MPLTTRSVVRSKPRRASVVVTFAHSACVKARPTGKGDVSVAWVRASRENRNEPTPAVAINTVPVRTMIQVRVVLTVEYRPQVVTCVITRLSYGNLPSNAVRVCNDDVAAGGT